MTEKDSGGRGLIQIGWSGRVMLVCPEQEARWLQQHQQECGRDETREVRQEEVMAQTKVEAVNGRMISGSNT